MFGGCSYLLSLDEFATAGRYSIPFPVFRWALSREGVVAIGSDSLVGGRIGLLDPAANITREITVPDTIELTSLSFAADGTLFWSGSRVTQVGARGPSLSGIVTETGFQVISESWSPTGEGKDEGGLPFWRLKYAYEDIAIAPTPDAPLPPEGCSTCQMALRVSRTGRIVFATFLPQADWYIVREDDDRLYVANGKDNTVLVLTASPASSATGDIPAESVRN
jgi:hypothetical protein